jgi:hypothetical protein
MQTGALPMEGIQPESPLCALAMPPNGFHCAAPFDPRVATSERAAIIAGVS